MIHNSLIPGLSTRIPNGGMIVDPGQATIVACSTSCVYLESRKCNASLAAISMISQPQFEAWALVSPTGPREGHKPALIGGGKALIKSNLGRLDVRTGPLF